MRFFDGQALRHTMRRMHVLIAPFADLVIFSQNTVYGPPVSHVAVSVNERGMSLTGRHCAVPFAVEHGADLHALRFAEVAPPGSLLALTRLRSRRHGTIIPRAGHSHQPTSLRLLQGEGPHSTLLYHSYTPSAASSVSSSTQKFLNLNDRQRLRKLSLQRMLLRGRLSSSFGARFYLNRWKVSMTVVERTWRAFRWTNG